MLIGTGIFAISFFGLYMLLTGLFPSVHPRVNRAVGARAGKKETSTQVLTRQIAVKMLPFISLEDMKRQDMANSLRALDMGESPELFYARAWATGILYALLVLAFLPLFIVIVLLFFPGEVSSATVVQFGVALAAVMLYVGYRAVTKELAEKIKARREAIEWELPQFSGTVLQCLGHTRNVIDILESYRKICGPALKREIEQTLNDMRTGNQETAVKNLAARINSGAFTQLAQGLLGLMSGDDQTSYFQIITKDFSKSQHELMKKEYIARPSKLTINNFLLLAGMLLMLFVAIGSFLVDTSAALF